MAEVTSVNAITITAKDETGQAFTSAANNVKRYGSSLDALQQQLTALKNAQGSMDQALSQGRFAGAEGIADQTMRALNQQIQAVQGQITKLSADGAGGMEKLRLGTAGVTREFIILGHEALVGNFSRIPGSILVLLERMGNLHSLLSATGAIFGAVAAAFAILIAAFVKGQAETDAMNQAIAKTGDYAGLTRGQMLALGNQIAETGKVSIGAARDLVTQLVASGKIGAQAIGEVAGLAGDYARMTGESIDQVGKDLIKLFSDPTKGARELIDSFGGVSVATEEYIRHLQQQGDIEQAQLVLADALAAKLAAQPPQLGFVQKAWELVRSAASSAWDAMLGIGRTQTPEDAYAAARQAAANARAGLPGAGTDFGTALGNALGGSQDAVAASDKVLENTREMVALRSKLNDAEAQATANTKLELAGQEEVNKGYAGQIKDLQDKIQLIKNAAAAEQHTTPDQVTLSSDQLSRVAQLQKQIFDTRRAADADHRAAVLGDIQGQEQVALIANKAAQDEVDAALKQGQIDKVTHDQRITQLQLEANLIQQNLAKQQAAYPTQDAQARATALRNLTALQADYNKIQHDGAAQVDTDLAQMLADVGKIRGVIPAYSADYTKMQEELDTLFQHGKISLQEYTDLLNALDAQQPGARFARQVEAAIVKANGAFEDFLGKLRDTNEKVKQQIDNLSLMPDQIARANAELAAQDQIDKELNDLATQYAAALEKNPALAAQLLDEINRLLDVQGQLVGQAGDLAQQYALAKRNIDDWKSVLSGIADEGAKFITDFVQHGSSAFKNLWNDFKTWALEAFAKIAAQTIIVNIAAAFGGTASAAANSLFGAGGSAAQPIMNLLGINPTGSLFGPNGALSFLSPTNLAGSFATSAVGQTIGLSTAVGGPAGIAADAVGGIPGGAAADVALTGAGSALTAIAPFIPLALAAIPLLSGLFGSSHGPKTQGAFAGSFDATGAFTGALPNAQDVVGIHGDNQSAAQAQQFGQGIATSFFQTLHQLGGTSAGLNFGVGFSTDPNGTAPSFVHTVVQGPGGSTIFQQNNDQVGRDDASLQAEVALQAQRAVLAALQASQLPQDIAHIIDSIDAKTATQDQIAAVETLATAVSTLGDSFAGLKTQIAGLNGDQIVGFVNALGGAQKAMQGLAFIQANFTTAAQQSTQAQNTLSQAWTSAGVTAQDLANAGLTQLPQTHEEFLKLLNSLDLTTQHGRDLAADLINVVAPAFVAVKGSADQAAQALNAAAANGQAYYNQHFLTPDQQTQLRVSNDETALYTATSVGKLHDALATLGYDVIPTDIKGVQALVNAVIAKYGVDSEEYKQLMAIIPVIGDLNDATGKWGDTVTSTTNQVTDATNVLITSVGSAIQQADQLAKTQLGNFASLANESTGNFGEKLSIQIGLISNAIKSADPSQFTSSTAFQAYINTLKGSRDQFTGELAQFTILSAQYDASRAEQLVQLEQWDAQQQQLFKGNADALTALNTVFQEKWNAIVNGVSTGVNGTIDQLDKLRQSIADYLQTLFTGSLSPLTPKQQLDQAWAVYQTDLTKAAAGDQTALGNITKDADALLKQGSSFYSTPSQAYRDLFNEVTHDLGNLAGTQPNGLPLPSASDSAAAAIANALPTGSTLASSADVRTLGETFQRIMSAATAANAEDIATQTDAITTTQRRTAQPVAAPLK